MEVHLVALEQAAFDILKSLAPCRLLSLGYPDLLLNEEFDVKEAEDWQKIASWHNWHGPIYDTEAVFREFGIDATYIDIHASRGCELVYDLNMDLNWVAPKFDVVLDPGTIEHCFNIGQAMWNVRKLCMVGGTIIHGNPISMTNHGFYNLSPTFYLDWYGHHGDEIQHAVMLAGPVGKRDVYEMPWSKRFSPPSNATSLVVARRAEGWGNGWPTQWKYQQNPELKHA